MKLAEALNKVQESMGLPNGDTILDIDTIEAEPSTYTNEKTGESTEKWKLTVPSGQNYSVPISLMRDIKKLVQAGAKKLRVTRTGKGVETRYTVIQI